MRHVSRLVDTASKLSIGLVLAVSLALPTQAADSTNLANHLVISEIKPGSDSSSQEYVELYNPTGVPVIIHDWSLQYQPHNRADDSIVVTSFGAGSVVPAYGYYLIAHEDFSGVADKVYDGEVLEYRGGAVMLVRSLEAVDSSTDTSIVDLVGYGDSDIAEKDPADFDSGDQSIERKPGMNFNEGNGVDTNNNENDFAARESAEPQNSSSPAEKASVPVISDVFPVIDGAISSETFTLKAKISDAHSQIDADSIVLHIDGNEIEDVDFDAATGWATVEVTLGEGTHTAHLTASDESGVMGSLTWHLTVDTIKPTVSLDLPDKSNNVRVNALLSASDSPAGYASGVHEMQISLDGTFDTETWIPFSTSLTQDLKNVAGQQLVQVRVRDRAGNVSEIASDTILLDFGGQSSPSNPISSTVSENGTNKITITWGSAPGAVAYLIRYSDGQTMYEPIRVNGTSAVISNLDPNRKYTFEVAAITSTDTLSGFTKVFPPELAQKPAGQEVVVTAITDTDTNTDTDADSTTELPFGGPDMIADSDTDTEATPAPTPSANPEVSPTPEGEVQSDEDSRSPDWTKVIVALSILIIAAGVATGGWYLYQWWTTLPKSNGKGKGKGGRW